MLKAITIRWSQFQSASNKSTQISSILEVQVILLVSIWQEIQQLAPCQPSVETGPFNLAIFALFHVLTYPNIICSGFHKLYKIEKETLLISTCPSGSFTWHWKSRRGVCQAQAISNVFHGQFVTDEQLERQILSSQDPSRIPAAAGEGVQDTLISRIWCTLCCWFSARLEN